MNDDDAEFQAANERVYEALVGAANRGPAAIHREIEKLGPNGVKWALTYAVMRERDRRAKLGPSNN